MANTNNTFTIVLDEYQMEAFETIMATRSNRTREQVMKQIVERGIYQLDYRSMRNKRVYAQQKEEREELKALRAQLRAQ